MAVDVELTDRSIECAHRAVRFGIEPSRFLRRNRKDDDGRNEIAIVTNGGADADLRRPHGVVASLARTVKEENDRPRFASVIVVRHVNDITGSIEKAGLAHRGTGE